MKDRFDEMMERFLVPLSQLRGHVNDCTYFLRNDGSLAFAQGYHHPAGAISGKTLYYPKPGGWVNIFGRQYECLHKTYRDGKMYSFTNPEQIAEHYALFPELVRTAPIAPIIKNNLLLPLDGFRGFFEPRKSLRLCVELYPKIRDGIAAASEILHVPVERMGLTGSLQYGRLEEHDDDTDIIFYGSVEENHAVVQRIHRLVGEEPGRHVHEFGKFWPLRLYHGGILVCPFFIYAREEEIPLRDCAVSTVKKGVALRGRVTDTRHSVYMPLVLPLEEATVDGKERGRFILILADSYVRGEFAAGQRIEATGELVRVTKGGDTFDALIAANNWDVTTVAGS
ncbi:MAG: hypothetical protein NT045_07775 [Candidatus Aureabacteria bacterium]|nr:hypothetical protein [Candidatus Auribacterota bacterium]